MAILSSPLTSWSYLRGQHRDSLITVKLPTFRGVYVFVVFSCLPFFTQLMITKIIQSQRYHYVESLRLWNAILNKLTKLSTNNIIKAPNLRGANVDDFTIASYYVKCYTMQLICPFAFLIIVYRAIMIHILDTLTLLLIHSVLKWAEICIYTYTCICAWIWNLMD